MEVSKEEIRYILQFFFDKGENASQVFELVNGVYGADAVTANYLQFWFRLFRSGIFDVKDAPRTGSPGQTLNPDICCQQLDCFKLAIGQKRSELANRRGVVFHQDKARLHSSVVTRQRHWELGWEVLMHPPKSPDMAPSDYHLFLALKNFLGDKK
ncbi:HTH_48 domain-containing protein [Trichonephila clavipes]|nr:HTH_48 domain-containing protein [Trichonephila clavipes]